MISRFGEQRISLISFKSTLRVGEIPLPGVKSGLYSGEIAEAVGGGLPIFQADNYYGGIVGA